MPKSKKYLKRRRKSEFSCAFAYYSRVNLRRYCCADGFRPRALVPIVLYPTQHIMSGLSAIGAIVFYCVRACRVQRYKAEFNWSCVGLHDFPVPGTGTALASTSRPLVYTSHRLDYTHHRSKARNIGSVARISRTTTQLIRSIPPTTCGFARIFC